jgi:hypothetical protein
MLLHVVEPDGAVDPAADPVAGDIGGEDVNDRFPLLDHLEDVHALDRPLVPGLAARFGIETGPVEDERGTAVDDAAADDVRFEFEQGGILKVEAPCCGGSGSIFHGHILIRL